MMESGRAHAMNAAIECNNVGVSLLGMGLIVESLDAFKAAAQILFPVSQSFHTAPSSPVEAAIQQMPPLPDTMKEEDDNTTVQHVKATLSLAEESAVPKNDLATDDSFMCVDPLTLAFLEGEPTSCTMESAIIVMNMGLAYHLYGSEPCLIQALSLFDMAFDISHLLVDDLRSEKVAMASLNNAAHIQHFFGNYLCSRHYLNILQDYICSLPETSNQMKKKARDCFMLNATLLEEPKTARAA
jgi:hypothetical protein